MLQLLGSLVEAQVFAHLRDYRDLEMAGTGDHNLHLRHGELLARLLGRFINPDGNSSFDRLHRHSQKRTADRQLLRSRGIALNDRL